MASSGPHLLLLQVLLLAMMPPHQALSLRVCLPADVTLECGEGQAILVESAFLGVSGEHNQSTDNCPKTSVKCHQFTLGVSQFCNRRQTCILDYPYDTAINLQNGCGLTNYIEVTYTCVHVSTTINICGYSGERGPGANYIVNNNYPLAISSQPHRCQCTMQRDPDSTTSKTGVTLVVGDAYFAGSNCQQKLYVEFLGYSTQSSIVCSSNTRVARRTIFSRSAIQNGEIISLVFDKIAYISDAGTFVIEAQAPSRVGANLFAVFARREREEESRLPDLWQNFALLWCNVDRRGWRQ